MTDKAKNSRRIAKGNFTRKRNILIKSIETSQGIEVVETNYSKLVDAWEELEGKHLEYVNLLTDEHLVDEEEIWMTEVEEKYSDAFNRKVKYVENVTTSEKATREHAARQEAIDNAKVKRNTARAVFEASYESISHALQSKEMPNFALKDLQKQIEDQFQDCKTFNAELLELLPFESAESEMQWIFTPADAPWQNGVTEALIRSVKRAIEFSVGENALTFSELQTVLFEIANLLNERPIGRHPTSPEDGAYLCPNDLLLGRATSRIPNGPFDENANTQKRFTFVQTIVHTFWKKWNSNYFPSLILRQKWHTSHRNLKIGDVVMIQDSNLVRGNWKLEKVSNVYPGADGKVRRVDVQYKNLTANEPMKQYQGKGYVTVQRPVQRLVLLIPIDENKINF